MFVTNDTLFINFIVLENIIIFLKALPSQYNRKFTQCQPLDPH